MNSKLRAGFAGEISSPQEGRIELRVASGDEHYKNDEWDIIVHERGSRSPDSVFGVFDLADGHPWYGANTQQWYTDWTVNGKRQKQWWPKGAVMAARVCPVPEGIPTPDSVDINTAPNRGEVHRSNIGGATNDQFLVKAFMGEAVYSFYEQYGPIPLPPKERDGS